MSMTLMAKAMSIKVGNHLRKLVLIKLADNANDKGECWPSYQHVADQCECSKSAVKGHINSLIDMGLVSKENRLGVNNGKGNTSNVYYLMLDNPMAPESIGGGAPKNTGPMASKNPPMAPDNPPPRAGDGTRTSHSLEPVNEPLKTIGQLPAETDREVQITDDAKIVLKHLNLLTGSRYQPAKGSLANIRARLSDGHDLASVILVVDYKFEHWDGTEHAQYLRPSTLFQPSKFEGYLISATRWDEQNRPKCVNGKWQRPTQLTQATSDIPEGFNKNLPAAPTQGGSDDGYI
ncbi:conserved phage C-terminal domain-containing protein [Serratia sp. M24T3]|uniref:conserved phage C-terminal domain-containing protein n=1 Tax=Serratia sp. M24T3 TaxID=932213 RepID=UPI00025BB64C|nr:conserved phage C-terminal domain-containing protein [Serratia sp. M24T3]EIC83337.1 replication protein [Serratia sp. M24T3]